MKFLITRECKKVIDQVILHFKIKIIHLLKHKVMKKLSYLIVLLSLLTSCNNNQEVQQEEKFQPSPSSNVDLLYPIGVGSSGDEILGLLGYGYDATGFCDTISVRAKVLENIPKGNLGIGYISSTFPVLVSGADFAQLLGVINFPYNVNDCGVMLASHLKSLLKLANKSDSIDSKSAYVYNATTYYYSHNYYYYGADTKNYITPDFKKDVLALSASELVAKYGTHILTNVFGGIKFEVLYRFKSDSYYDENVAKEYFQARMKEYIGGIPMYIKTGIAPVTKKIKTDEQFIYNSIGCRKKLCGVITSTDSNPDSITVDVNQVFKAGNYKPQFIAIGERGTIPIYELISDETKKQEVKTYIDKYMKTSRVN